MAKKRSVLGVIFVVLVTCLTGAFTANVQITPGVKNLLVGQGNKQTLNCFVTDDQSVNKTGLTWKLPQPDTIVTISNEKDSNSSISSILTITNFTDKHVGVYNCSYTDADGDKNETSINLASLIENKTEGEFFFGNKSATLICTLEDLPNGAQHVFLKWHKDNKTLECDETSKDKKFTCYDNGTLIINKPTRKDAGLYKVTYNVTGDYGPYYDCDVFYRAAPLVHNMAKSKNLEEGDQLDLYCEVIGYPTPNVTWLKNGVIISKDDHTLMFETSSHQNIENAHLTIKSVKQADGGKYTCKATDVFGQTSVKSIIVRIKDNIEWLWPIIGIICEAIVLSIIIIVCNKVKNKHLVD